MNPPKVSSSGHRLDAEPSTDATAGASSDAATGAQPTRPSVSRRRDGFWSNLKRSLAPRPVTVSNSLIGSVTTVRPTTARAKIGVAENQRHAPNRNASPPAAVATHTRNAAFTFAGTDKTAPADQLIDRGGVEAVAARLFNPSGLDANRLPPQQLASELGTRLGAPANSDMGTQIEAAARQELVLRRMHQAFGNDAGLARAALHDLRGAGQLLEVEGGAFELARRLAASSLGFGALHALRGDLAVDADPVKRAIREDATKLALRAANALIAALPEGRPAPQSLDEVVALAITALPEHERPTGITQAPAQQHMNGDVGVPAKALLAAVQLAEDPAAEPELHLKSAYLAWRCGFTHEGPGTPLAHAQHRLFKLSRYARRASQPGMFANLRRAFGFNKSPMSALALGTGGASLRQPEDDLLKADVIWQLGGAFAGRAQSRGERPAGARLADAVHAATLELWYQRIAHKGWRDKTSVSTSMRHSIAARAAVIAGATETEVKLSPEYAALKSRAGSALTVAVLESWIDRLAAAQPQGDTTSTTTADHAENPPPPHEAEASAAASQAAQLKAALKNLATLERNGEVSPDPSTPQTVLEHFRRVITEPRMTYDVRLSDGGQFGVNTSVTELLNLPGASKLPFVLAGPDVKLIHGRHAMINGGSSANHGQLFIGSDRRWASHAGVSAASGVNLFNKTFQAIGSAQVLPAVFDLSQPKGVMVRARLQPTGTPPAGQQPAGEPDPWRAKLLGVIDAATASGPNGALPNDAGSMWDAIAHAFYKDPDVSVNWLESKGQSLSTTANASAGVRVEHDGYKFGPSGQLGGTRTWFTRTRRQEQNGSLKAAFVGSSNARMAGASATLVAGLAPQGAFSDETGHVKSVVLPNVSIVGFGTTVLQSETGSTWRIAEEDGHIDASLSYRDTTFTSVKEFKRFVDSRRASWDDAYHRQPAGAAQPEPIDEYLARVEQDATRGNQLYAERVWLKPDVARQINILRELRDAVVPPGVKPGERELAQIDRRNAQIAGLLHADESWDKRFLYSLEINGATRAVGPTFLATAQRVTEVSHPRQLSVLRVERAVNPDDTDRS
ncbi:hypothetical protein EN871_24110 [bacterium M00.F.Ca.ET.228.01.1.1]|uniref:hypothetical protein n=3 Tax=Pseudomonadota TaxID=1224 RepID=UPI00109271F8|nr:hypothetical protein [Paraburkholderia phenoliruptrix]TGP41539.1 hypothetical protein EN871_24110 [bacterium M00.F.Ca.ET.228.01.1.1]TGR98197.1 hypothetical protein EN834_23725 [bacterium M00.F.Ca.ET.191.01.1.1]TGU02388.1 hypothetical protein EN798_24545 [bacterium M00.F.Ca.ET.155.01.1.1]MBW0447191.1 hypothetical protein [Paraburkholderia phenoliruptrix]MBW9101426.1 hypothetical protein [Paraburkholderia phenoliruptrix]